MNRIQRGDWIPGAVIRVFSARRGVWHFGIAGWNHETIWHASKDRGYFLLTTLHEFAEDQPCVYVFAPETNEIQKTILIRAEGQVGKPYQLFASNCEDYVNWIVCGVARSPQREQAALVALIILLLGGLGS
jgi:Lecithin retinol acyltransferase